MSDVIGPYLTVLGTSRLFSHLREDQIASMFSRVAFSLRRYEKSVLIAQRGDPIEDLLILVSGELSADFLSHDGRVLKVENLTAPSLVASTVLFADNSAFPVQLSSHTDSAIISIPKAQLLSMAAEDPIILENLLRDSGNRLAFLADKLKFIGFDSIEKKVAGYILDLRQRQRSDNLVLPHSIQMLSELFGVARPSVSRVFGHLEERGLIEKSGKTVSISDASALIEILQ